MSHNFDLILVLGVGHIFIHIIVLVLLHVLVLVHGDIHVLVHVAISPLKVQ
jgi:hypothetical protein